MNIKTGVLAAVAALSLAVPAAALAQPFHGPVRGYAVREEFRRDDWRRFERQREFRRMEELRRLRWEREHAYRYGHDYRADDGYRSDYGRGYR